MRWVLATICVLAPAATAAGRGPQVGGLIGGSPSDDAAVVRLDVGAGLCTGVVVAPRVVLTAAHCVAAATGTVAIGSAPPWDAELVIDRAIRHRAATLFPTGYDLALVHVTAPVTVAAAPVRATDASVVTALRVVGFGRRVADDPRSIDVRTAATLAVVGHDDAVIYATGDGVATCLGDSGAPGFDALGRVTAVVSAGDCAGQTRLARVDHSAAWIAEVVAAWDGPCAADGACAAGCVRDPDCDRCGLEGTCAPGCPGPDLDCPLGPWFGARCADDAGCESRHCRIAPDDVTTRFCSRACDAQTPCPAPITACVAGACAYPGGTPGRLGVACADDQECASALCDPGAGVCAVRCDADGTCPGDQACATTSRGPVCRRATGCAAGGDGGGLIMLLAASVAARARRRARRRS